jgi:hypothetical protein
VAGCEISADGAKRELAFVVGNRYTRDKGIKIPR